MPNVKGSKKRKDGRFVENRKDKLIGFKVEEDFLAEFEKVLKFKGTDKSHFMREQIENFMESYKQCECLAYMALDEFDIIKEHLALDENALEDLETKERINLYKEAERLLQISRMLGDKHPLHDDISEFIEFVNKL